ncbi:MAG: NAD(P)/FAD-dependent oxidoreductase [Anaerolineae bacterium]|nr:NAD(P)/FAD-dependent oxidoreductase [Anaerolineae bacterium]
MEGKEERDVIVVGAGPAGAMTATILAQKGHDVLLLDRAAFPRDKTCGDAVPAGAIERMNHYGMKEKVETAVARGEFYPLKSLKIVSPRAYEIQAPLEKGHEGCDSYVAPRMYFDHVIQQHAIDSGAQFCVAQAKEPIMENDKVVGVRAQSNGRVADIRARLVVGADGVTSAIARRLRPKTEQHEDAHRAVALRAYIDDLEEIPHAVEFYLYKDILPGYAWIFPIGENRANIGLGMRLDQFRKHKLNLEKMLQAFLQMPAIKSRLRNGGQLHDVATWQLNFGSQAQMQHVFDGALLVGDAAGFINPITGGGIHNSIISAELAAQIAHDALIKGDTSYEGMKNYEQLCHDELWESMQTSYRMQNWFVHFPVLVDILVRFGRQSQALTQTFLSKL